ncbi:MAG: hypothetical protein J07HX5_02076, partial [halophilic archaeon J07HX5]
MTSYTRRGALMMIAGGCLYWAVGTDAFDSAEVDRSVDIGTAQGASALLNINPADIDSNKVFDVSTEPHEIVVTNQTDSQLEITVESQNNQSNYRFGTNPNDVNSDSITVPLSPGEKTSQSSNGIFISTDETGTITEAIKFNADSQTGS